MKMLAGGAAIYGLAVGGLYLLQDSMIFPRTAALHPVYPLPAATERLELVTASGQRIYGNLTRARDRSRGLLLGFAGNAWNADDCTTFLATRMPDVDVVVFHYRGYAPSEGLPSEAALYADALQIFDSMDDLLDPVRIMAAGFSLGSGVAAYLASQRPLDGLILITPFDSVAAIAAARYPWMPVRPLLRHPFRSDLHLRGRDVPAAVIIAGEDTVVPAERSEALVRALAQPVMVRTIPFGTHQGIYDLPEIDDALRDALEAVIAARSRTGLAPRPSISDKPQAR